MASIAFGSGLASIGYYALGWCHNLESVYFMTNTWNLTDIDQTAFWITDDSRPTATLDVFSPNNVAKDKLTVHNGAWVTFDYHPISSFVGPTATESGESDQSPLVIAIIASVVLLCALAVVVRNRH
jgi:hypothetical protein